MSSIFGKCHTDKKPVTAGDLKLMQDELNHWKADDANVWNSGAAGLGHLMLYNTLESLNEKLPLHVSLSGLTITADARVDNREELCTLLHINTPGKKLLPDSTIILLLYKKYGEDCVKYLVGDFAFAIWGEKEQKLFCARDQMGVKPFFYCHTDQFLAFASEKKGLLCLPEIDKAIDKQFYYNQVFWPHIQAADTTLYKNIKRLAPAHTLTWYAASGIRQLHRYWTLDAFKETIFSRKEDYYEGLLQHFEEAVRCRTRSHYAIGAELSGGMDSSAITGAASHFLKSRGSNIISLSNVLSDDDETDKEIKMESERRYIDDVIKFNGITDPVFLSKDIWEDLLDEIDFAIKVNDGLEMWSLLWELPVKNAARQRNIRTLLSGFPGDEMVTYRGDYFFLDYLDRKQYRQYFSAKGRMPFKKIKPFISPGLEFIIHKLKNILTLNDEKGRRTAEFFKMPAFAKYTRGDVVWRDENYLERYKSYRHFQKYRLLKAQVPLRMEAETRFGISFRTEPRFPMADIRLTQYCLSMPNYIKYDGPLTRTAYRAAVGKYLPESLLKRDSKLGNTAPFRSTPNALTHKQDTLNKLFHSIENNNKYYNIIIKQSNENKYNQIAILELLRWFEKNFGNL